MSDLRFDIRPARPDDLRAIQSMIRELAAFERLDHLCVATVLPDWRIVRVVGRPLAALCDPPPGDAAR